MASSICGLVMAFLPSRAANNAASLSTFARSAPVKPGVRRAYEINSTSFEIGLFFAWTLSISSRPFKSGRSTAIWRSKRPGRSRAGSRTSGRFVAAIKIT